MRRIEDEAARMGVLVDDMLLLARLDQGRPLEREPVDLGAVAADLVDDARMLAPGPARSSCGWTARPIVTGDELRLRQAVGNLLANARAHTPEGTPVAVAVTGRRRQVVTVEVADDGPGIDAEDLPRVFERFYRADPSRSRASGGSGLGLVDRGIDRRRPRRRGRRDVRSRTGSHVHAVDPGLQIRRSGRRLDQWGVDSAGHGVPPGVANACSWWG